MWQLGQVFVTDGGADNQALTDPDIGLHAPGHLRPVGMGKAEDFRALHEGEPFVMPNPLGRRLGAGPCGARLPGAGDHELGIRVHARPAGRRRDAR